MEEPMLNHPVARRSVIAGAGAGLVSALVGEAKAQREPAQSQPEVQATEYSAQKGDTKLYLYRKRIVATPGEKQPVLFLVHGSSNSSRSS
jgi:acetyl esterase/lipase